MDILYQVLVSQNIYTDYQEVWERHFLECVLWENLSPGLDSQLHIISVSEWNKIIIATGSLFFQD